MATARQQPVGLVVPAPDRDCRADRHPGRLRRRGLPGRRARHRALAVGRPARGARARRSAMVPGAWAAERRGGDRARLPAGSCPATAARRRSHGLSTHADAPVAPCPGRGPGRARARCRSAPSWVRSCRSIALGTGGRASWPTALRGFTGARRPCSPRRLLPLRHLGPVWRPAGAGMLLIEGGVGAGAALHPGPAARAWWRRPSATSSSSVSAAGRSRHAGPRRAWPCRLPASCH